jgi:DNA-binding XRE family transcriptional regulator
MRIFISWSGERSGRVATVLQAWIPRVVQAVRPWLSSASIDPGARWGAEVSEALQDLQFGVLCLTPENITAPWVLFEAGALSKSVSESRLVPYLVGFEARELEGPLAQFQNVQADRRGTYQLVTAINAAAGERGVSSDVLGESFDVWWPRLEPQLREIAAASPAETPTPTRSTDDMLGEVLSLLRAQRLAVSPPTVPVEPEPLSISAGPLREAQVSLGNRVRALRVQRGLSQSDVARLSGISQAYVSQVETGRIYPTSWVLVAIATVLGMTPEDLTAP